MAWVGVNHPIGNLVCRRHHQVKAAGRYKDTIRLLTVARVATKVPVVGPAFPKLNQPWSVASPNAVWDGKSFGLFSAECWLVGTKMVQAEPTVPVGLVSSCWSGSMIQPWLPADVAGKSCRDSTPREPFNTTPMGVKFDFARLPARTPHGAQV